MIRLKVIQIILIIFGSSLYNSGNSSTINQELPDTVKGMSDLEKIRYLGELSWKLNAMDNDLAVAYGQYSLNLADSLNLHREVSEISGYLGVAMLYYQNNIKMAWKYFRDALDYAILANDSVQIGYAFDNIGYMYFLHGNLTTAQEYYEDAYEIFERMNQRLGLAYVSTSIGLIKNARGNYSGALESYNRALQLHTEENNLAGQAAVYSCMGETWLNKNEYVKAKDDFEQQIKISQQISNDKYLAEGLKGIADIWYHQGDFSPALDFIDRALEIAQSKNDDYLVIEARIIKALVLAGLEQFEEGEQQLEMAFEIAKKIGLPQKIYEVYQGYSSFYDAVGDDYIKNYSIYGDLFGVYDSLYREYEKEKLANEEQRIEISNNLTEARDKLEQKRMQQLYSFAFVFLLLTIGVILFWRYNTSKKLTSKLVAANDELNDSIVKKNKALHSLQKSKKELLESNATKSRLFSIIAHDLKSPFQSILGFSELLMIEHKTVDENIREDYITNLHDGLQRVYNLLDNLLIWAGTQTDKIQFSPELVNVSEAIVNTIQLQEILAENKNIGIDIKIEEDIQLYADLNMLNTVVRNLISNAIKFTPEGGKIRIQANLEKKGSEQVFRFTVTDTGVGIPEQQLSGLFNEKNKIVTAGTNSEKGTGLGLQLCSDLVKLHDGQIWAESEVKKGSRFTFIIPVKKH